MISSVNKSNFVKNLLKKDKSIQEIAVGLIWLEELKSPDNQMSLNELKKNLEDLGVTSYINPARLANILRISPYLIDGKLKNTFRLALKTKDKVNDIYKDYLETPIVSVSHDFLYGCENIQDKISNSLVRQINGCYQYTFYDACANLCRRLVEYLVIKSFENLGLKKEIIKDNQIIGFNDLISKIKSGNFFHMTRDQLKSIESIRFLGNSGAHSNFYIMKKKDLDEIKLQYVQLVAELISIANIK